MEQSKRQQDETEKQDKPAVDTLVRIRLRLGKKTVKGILVALSMIGSALLKLLYELFRR